MALLLTLTLPDVCVALEQPDGRTDGKRMYKAWYKANIHDVGGPALTPDEAYELRSTVVHQSRAQGSSARSYSRILFTMKKTNVRVHNSIANDARIFDVTMFCEDWIGAVRQWIERAKANQVVQGHLPDLLQVRPMGLAPYMVGMPIIA